MTDLYVGDILYGYCGGAFGDSYDEKTVLHVGRNYVVVQHPYMAYKDGKPWREEPTVDVYNGDPKDLVQYLEDNDD